MNVAAVPFDYSASRQAQQEGLRAAILSAATQLLANHGMSGLSVRALAAEVGASTKVIYSHYGGKPGIISALYTDGFGRLAEVMQNAAECPGTPPERLLDLARAYRAFALEAPHLYELIYGPRVREILPLPSDRDEARRLQQIITGLFQEGQERGFFRQTDPEDAARTYWAALHGTISLELATWFNSDEGEQRLEQLAATVLGAESCTKSD